VLGDKTTLTVGAVLPMVTLALAVAVPARPSLAVAVQPTVCPAENAPARLDVVAVPLLAATALLATDQAKPRVGVSPSGSVALPVQTSVLARVGLAGERVAVTEGARLARTAVLDAVALPASASVAVAVQAMASPGAAAAGERVRLGPLPRAVARVVLAQA